MIKQVNRKYNNTYEQLLEKQKKLKTIINIIDSDLEEFDKAYQLYKLFNNSKKFRSAYLSIYKYGKDDRMFKDYIYYFEDIYQIYLKYENKGYFEVAKAISEIEVYLINYHNAINVVNLYLELECDYNFYEFLDEMEITEKDFNFYIKTISILNTNLFKKYESKVKENKEKRYSNNIEICRKVANGIRTGYLSDGTKFDLLEFWKLMPFKNKRGVIAEFLECRDFNEDIVYSPLWINRLYNFTKVVLPDDSKLIYDYARSNNIRDCTCVTELELKYMFGTITKVKKIVIDDMGNTHEVHINLSVDDFNNMIKYMKNNKMPLILEIFNLVFDKYVNGEIVIDDNKKLIKK